MKYYYILVILFCFSCGKEKSIQLPEISKSNIHDIKDVSPAYLFYDESEKGSIELNRKNLISTTNWLVNVDKRLTLKQAIPSIIKLQEKKRDAKMHKNEAAKNYFTCNDKSVKNLGFIEFTDVIYHNGIDKSIVEHHSIYDSTSTSELSHTISLLFKENDSISINSELTTKAHFLERLRFMDSVQNKMMGLIYLKFNENLTFQDYITFKSMLLELKLKHSVIANDEYIFN